MVPTANKKEFFETSVKEWVTRYFESAVASVGTISKPVQKS